MRTVIADDEPLACERIRTLLAEEPEVRVVAECRNGAEAVRAVTELRPDLLILDIQMPRLNGFEVLEAIGADDLPAVIFTTAHDEHAIRAFEVNALDYLLKPFTEARFLRALKRARSECANLPARARGPGLGALLEQLRTGGDPGRILVRSPDRILFLKPGEIDYVEAAGNYVVLHSGRERHILRETTAAMEQRLAASGFLRISRSAVVNLARIREVQPVSPGQYVVVLADGTRLPMTCALSELQARL